MAAPPDETTADPYAVIAAACAVIPLPVRLELPARWHITPAGSVNDIAFRLASVAWRQIAVCSAPRLIGPPLRTSPVRGSRACASRDVVIRPGGRRLH